MNPTDFDRKNDKENHIHKIALLMLNENKYFNQLNNSIGGISLKIQSKEETNSKKRQNIQNYTLSGAQTKSTSQKAKF